MPTNTFSFDIVEQLRKTERGKQIYKLRKESIERVFGDAKEKHAMRYTHHRGLARVSHWVKLKFAAMNLKSLQIGCGKGRLFSGFGLALEHSAKNSSFLDLKTGVL